MRMRLVGTGISILVLLLAAFVCYAAGTLTAAGIIEHMDSAAARLDNLSADISVQIYKDGSLSLTQQMHLVLDQPDKMRLKYLKPEYLAANVTLIVGEKMWMYVAAIDKWFEKDLATLSPAEQPWLMFRNVLRGVRSMLDDYTFTLVEEKSDAYHIRGVPANDDAVYGRVDLWMDAETFLPLQRIVYDMDGNLLVDARFLEAKSFADGVTLPLRVETYNADGKLANVISYLQVEVNAGVSQGLFAPPEAGDD